MKDKTNAKIFIRLLIGCVVTSFLVLPYTLALSPMIAQLMTPVVLAAQLVQATIIFAIAIWVGLSLSKKVGFQEPTLDFKNTDWKLAGGLGVLSGVLIILLSFLFSSLSMTFLQAELGVETWKGLLASFYGGFAEEVVSRLFLMSLLTWILGKVIKNKNISVWGAILISTIIFGLGHLGITGGITVITGIVVLRAILLNGVSVFFGWLYWKKGLESAMIAHFSADIVVHVITPMVARLIV